MTTGPLHTHHVKDNCFRYASVVLRWIVESSAILEEKQRRRVRLLSIFLLIIAINTLIGAMVMEKAGNSLWYIMLATFAILSTGYGLSRSQYYGLATVVAVTIPAVPIVAMILFSANQADIPTQLPWLALPLLVSSLLLSLRQTIIIAISYIIIIVILMPFADVPKANLSESLSLMLMITFFVIAITATRQQDQSEIEHELTERKQAGEALRVSEDKYHAFFEQASDSIVLIDHETAEIVDFNDKAHQNLGYSRKEFARLKLSDIDAIESAEDARRRNEKIRTEGINSFETKHRTKSGEMRDIQVSTKALNIGGKSFGLCLWHDITEQKRAEEKLRASEERYHAIFEQASDAILLFDTESGALVEFNNKAHNDLGYSRQEFAKIKLIDIDASISPGTVLRNIEKISKEGAGTFETKHRAKSGEVRDVYVNSRIFSIGGRKLAVSIWSDITERKQVEEKLRASEDKYHAIFEQASDSIVLIDTETEALVDFNDRAHQNLGYSREEFSKLKVTDIDVVESHEETIQHLEKTYGGGTDVFETKQRTNGGDIRDILVSIKILNISGKTFSLAVWHDITDQKRAEEKLKQALANLEYSNTQLAAINKELEAFSYSVSHDLRAPLRTIDGFSQALLEDYLDKLDEQGQDYLKRVRAASQRMGALIDDLLKLSRLSRSDMHQEPVDLSMLAEEIAAELQQTQPERHAEFIIGKGLMASGDRQLLRIALGNLFANAWKFTGKHQQARIEFGITHNGSKKAYYVRDNGDGFDMKYADKLFAPFQRLHDAAEFPGNGIGLVTVQRIIHRHGGSIRAEGAVGQGATFYFTLS